MAVSDVSNTSGMLAKDVFVCRSARAGFQVH